MKVLFVNNLLPYPPIDGGRIRRLQLLLALARDHEVTLLAPMPEPHALREFRSAYPHITCREIPWTAEQARIPLADAVREALAAGSFDVVHVSELWQWPGERALAGLPVVLDSDNVESTLLARLSALEGVPPDRMRIATIQALERQAYARADVVLACSEADAALIRQISPNCRTVLIPNGVDLERFPLLPPPGPDPVFTFTGMLCYRPNVDAATYFATEIWPLVRERIPSARFRIVGRAPAEEVLNLADCPGVEVLADVPDIRPYYVESCAMVVPLRAGSGTRLKILEAFACGRPVVSTALGCEGLEVRDGEQLRIADRPEAFAEALIWAAEHPVEARDLAERARQWVEQRHGWDRIGAELREVYSALEK